ncbi:MAG: FAD/NAD(P)-binding oxidoreductase [Pseudomonadota bacterium]
MGDMFTVPKIDIPTPPLSRRDLLALAAASGALAAVGPGRAIAAPVETSARIAIVGGGAAGTSIASRLAAMTSGATITLMDARKDHYFQPGYTLVGSGVWSADQVVTPQAQFIADGVTWIEAHAAEIDPETKRVTATTGETVDYDYLVIATGLKLNYDAIPGMSEDLIGKDGITSIYAGPEAAAASWNAMQTFVETGGVGLFGRPPTEMKCAGAPLKYTFLADDHLRRAGNRGSAELIYNAHNQTVFAVPVVHDRVLEIFSERDISVNWAHNLVAIEPGGKVATYATEDGTVDIDYDFIHIIPPMSAPDVVRNSSLPWQEGAWGEEGWIEVDPVTLQHVRYPEVFGVGDINGVPKGKTAASVKWQAPVVAENMIAMIAEREMTAGYNGYTSCPMVTGVGKAMLIEFDYDGNLMKSFPFIDPLKEMWLSWLIEEKALLPAYNTMLRGMA